MTPSPDAFTHITDDLTKQGATILLAKLDETGGYSQAPLRVTIIFEYEGTKTLWSHAGILDDDGRFQSMIGRQHPITDAAWEAMKRHTQ